MGVKNRLAHTYDAPTFSAGYRDVSLYLRFVESKYPTHIVQLRVELQCFVDVAGVGGDWVQRLFRAAKPFKIVDDPARVHIGPVDRSSAASIRDGVTQSVCMDHFPFSLSGGDTLIAALSQAQYCAVQVWLECVFLVNYAY